ncbi:MAG TPA: tRNA pseudouridine(55) synthase TruB [Chloroflexota bacterium]|nr:tRNA pseudouridine(55) synthase TruB [Chloroflexota bacterium]
MSGARQPFCGILNVDKPLGWTSHDVVALVRRLSGQRQVGHAGTLDPLATGVLLVTLGAATRLAEYLMHGRKCYLARVRLGIRTTTDDAEGQVMLTRPTDGLTRERVIAALAGFRGAIRQVPPSYAAIKQGGVPAYTLARQGKAAELPARTGRIDGLALLSAAARSEADVLDILVWCSAGTYIRALARDLGEVLGCGGYLQALRRLSSGSFGVEGAVGVTALRRLAAEGRLHERLHPMDDAVASWPALVVDDMSVAAVQHGQAITASEAGDRRPTPCPEGTRAADAARSGATGDSGASFLPPAACRLPPDQARIYARHGRLLALARYDARRQAWQPWKVLAPAGLSAEGRPVSTAEPGPSTPPG